MSNGGSGKKLEGFFTGKGFYIVLFLCATVIGVSAWMMATGKETMENKLDAASVASFDNARVETVIVPPEREESEEALLEKTVDAEAPAVSDEGLSETAGDIPEEAAQVWNEGITLAESPYVWPVQGELERLHDTQALDYDVTMRDWRTHDGVDILAPLGATVCAAHSGVVESIGDDDFYGTVVTIDHKDGTKSVYANLAELPAVNVGDWVEPGSVVGSVGTTALCETGQSTHLHFAMYCNGASANPLDYLPA